MKIDILGFFYLEGRFLVHILELCRTRRKRLYIYILQEINPRWLQMTKCFFMKNWGWDQTLEVKGCFLIVKVQFLKKVWKKEDQCTSIFNFADRPEVPYEVDFWRNSCPTKNRFSDLLTLLDCFGGWLLEFLRDLCNFVRSWAWNRDGKCC